MAARVVRYEGIFDWVFEMLGRLKEWVPDFFIGRVYGMSIYKINASQLSNLPAN